MSAGQDGQAGEPAAIAVRAELIGQPARLVVRYLRQAGLVPRVEWSDVGQIPAGTVIGVRPEGNLSPGTVVTVTVAALPSAGKALPMVTEVTIRHFHDLMVTLGAANRVT